VTSAPPNVKAVLLLSLSAFVVWLACGLTMAFGRSAFGLETALRIHAIAAPVFAALVSLAYFARFPAVTPLVAAAFVTAFIIVLDAALVAPVFEKSYAMFSSVLETWLPFSVDLCGDVSDGNLDHPTFQTNPGAACRRLTPLIRYRP
jgi:hypothetical protein